MLGGQCCEFMGPHYFKWYRYCISIWKNVFFASSKYSWGKQKHNLFLHKNDVIVITSQFSWCLYRWIIFRWLLTLLVHSISKNYAYNLLRRKILTSSYDARDIYSKCIDRPMMLWLGNIPDSSSLGVYAFTIHRFSSIKKRLNRTIYAKKVSARKAHFKFFPWTEPRLNPIIDRIFIEPSFWAQYSIITFDNQP